MRKVPFLPSLIFFCITMLSVSTAAAGSFFIMSFLGQDFDFDLKNATAFFVIHLSLMIVSYQFVLLFLGRPTGSIKQGTKADFLMQLKLLLELFIFVPISESRLIPAPLTRLFYISLGASIGNGSYPSSATILDPGWVDVGDSVTFGYQSLLTPHILMDGKYELHNIKIGNKATIGVNVVIYGNVKVGEQALILANSSVVPGTRIGKGEIWGGNPAKLIKQRKDLKQAA